MSVGGVQARKRLVTNVLFGIAEYLFRRSGPRGDPAARIHHENCEIRNAIEQEMELLIALSERSQSRAACSELKGRRKCLKYKTVFQCKLFTCIFRPTM